MKNDASSKPNSSSPGGLTLAGRGTALGFVRRLKRPRTLGYLVFLLAALATLVGLFYLIENWRGTRAWRTAQAQLAAEGIVIDLSAYVPTPIPDEDNAALHPFLKPLFDFKPGTQEWRNPQATRQLNDYARDVRTTKELGRWSTGERADLGLWLRDYRTRKAGSGPGTSTPPEDATAGVRQVIAPFETDLDELMTYFQDRGCRFPVAYNAEPVYGILLPHLAVLRRLSTLATLRAEVRLASDESAVATDDLMFILDLAKAPRNEPFLISHLVRMAMVDQAVSVLWDGLCDHRWSEADLERIKVRLEPETFLPETRRSMLGELAGGLQAIDDAQRDPGLFYAVLETGDNTDYPLGFGLIWRLVPNGWFKMEKAEYSRLFLIPLSSLRERDPRQIDLQTFKTAWKEVERAIETSPWSALENHLVAAQRLIPAFPKAVQKSAFAEISVRLAVVACALEQYFLQHGAYPDSLGSLVPTPLTALPNDPLTGQPFLYRSAAGSGYMLYSVGWNLKDEDGLVVLTEDEKRQELASGDWVWRLNSQP